MNKPDSYNLPISFPKGTLEEKVKGEYNTLGIDFPDSKKDELISGYIQQVLENLSENIIIDDIKNVIGDKLSTGEIIRETEIIGDTLRNKEFTLTPYTKTWFNKKREEAMFGTGRGYGSRCNFTDNNVKKHSKEILKLLQADYAKKSTISAIPIENSCYPIEFMRELGLELHDAHTFAFTIVQVERLIKEKRIHMIGEKIKKRKELATNIFFIHRLDNTIKLLDISVNKFEPNRWDYLVFPLSGYKSLIGKGSKVFLNSLPEIAIGKE